MPQRTSDFYAQVLIAEESRAKVPSNSGAQAALRVCEKLRHPLTTLAGTAGFRSLLYRAVTLAKAKASWLEGLKLNEDGSFSHTPEIEARLATAEAAGGAAAVVAQLLGLLITFIGEALTLRLIHDVWPKVALKNSKREGN
jgi:hypothetical protein